MRVLLVSPYPDPRWLSMERYTERLVLRADRVTFSQAYGSYFRPPRAIGWALPMYRGRPALQPARAVGNDLVHVTDHALAHHIPLFRQWPTVTTCHDIIPVLVGVQPASLVGRVRRKLYRRSTNALKDAPSIIAVSEFTKRSLVKFLGVDPERVDVVPVAIPDDFAPLEGANDYLAAQGVVLPPGPRVLSIGHAGRNKNLALLLEAMARPELAGAALVRVGRPLSGPLRERVTRLGLVSRVVDLGAVPAEVLLALYSACDVLAQPSWLEGFGIPVAEAQACGLPVVCSDGGSLPEVGGRAARIVPLGGTPGAQPDPDTVGRFASALAEVISDAALATTMRTRGFEQARQLRPDVVAPQLAAAYEKAMNRWQAR
ncbi:MAG: glycosyltransferase family 4 protein [Tepidiformaceae bacterium]